MPRAMLPYCLGQVTVWLVDYSATHSTELFTLSRVSEFGDMGPSQWLISNWSLHLMIIWIHLFCPEVCCLVWHVGQYHYVCAYCSKAFLTSYALRLHYRSHTQERPFACDFPDCYKAFNSVYRFVLVSTRLIVVICQLSSLLRHFVHVAVCTVCA